MTAAAKFDIESNRKGTVVAYKKGTSDNPAGRPKGIVDRRSALRTLLQEAAPNIVASLVARAKEGDVQAAKLILERTIPPLRPESEPVVIPELEAAAGLRDKVAAIIGALARGELASDVAVELLRPMAAQHAAWMFNAPTDTEKTLENLLKWP
jgi:hypothetical protein